MENTKIDPALAYEQDLIQKQRNKDDIPVVSEIRDFFVGKTLFITGATGFMGKHLVEKLLRSCNNLNRIYLLMRSKKDKNPEERLNEMLNDELFSEVKARYPEVVNKVHVLEGDVDQLDLGLIEYDRQVIAKEVEIIIHVAATVKFDAPLKTAVLTNVRGTREVFKLAKTCEHLCSLVYVSTAYCNFHHKDILERFYPTPVQFDTMIDMAENMDEDLLNDITIPLAKQWYNNTYTFSKSICEDVVMKMGVGLPVSIVRPTIVTAAFREPLPGWLDKSCIYTVSGLVFGSIIGVLSILLADQKLYLDMVPVDYANNAILAVTWKTGREFEEKVEKAEPPIYTVNSSNRNPLTFEKLRYVLRNECAWLASPALICHGDPWYIKNYYLYQFLSFFYHTIPAYLIDGIAMLFGKDLRLRLIESKFRKLMNYVEKGSTEKLTMSDKNLRNLLSTMTDGDKQVFNFDVMDINWKEYIFIWCIGLRKYVVKDGLQGTEYGKKKLFWIDFLHYMFLVCFYLGILYVIYCYVY